MYLGCQRTGCCNSCWSCRATCCGTHYADMWPPIRRYVDALWNPTRTCGTPSCDMCRRPRSPGPRPGSPLSGLSRPSAQSKSSSNSGHQEQSSYVNSTALAGSIYGRQQMSSRLGPMPRTGHKRPLHHQQKHCAFQIQVNYGPTGVNDQPEIDGNGCAANRLNVLNAPGTTVKCCAEQQPGARATSMAANTPTATAECSWHSGENNEQELGMTLSEYIAQMHTTPVACNSVSGALAVSHSVTASCARFGKQ